MWLWQNLGYTTSKVNNVRDVTDTLDTLDTFDTHDTLDSFYKRDTLDTLDALDKLFFLLTKSVILENIDIHFKFINAEKETWLCWAHYSLLVLYLTLLCMLAKTRHVTARHADKNHASPFLLALPADKNQTGKALRTKLLDLMTKISQVSARK